jgi:DNA-binding response OmpR family regulator
MALESLLLSRDVEVLRVLRPTLEKLAIEVAVFQEAQKASEILSSEKFDAVIVDCDDVEGGLQLLQAVRDTSSNKNSVTFAVLNGKKTTTQQAFGMGVNFVLQKPLTGLNAARCFNAALGFMERERRRYWRQPVEMAVSVDLEGKELKATSTNISEGGIALLLKEGQPKNGSARLRFTLPGSKYTLELESEIAWTTKGHAGLRFLNVPAESQERLQEWLNREIEKSPTPTDKTGSAASDSIH